ncbi:MAG: hypothetical protein HC848_06925, partial [Limnobacter sp.]|nr:hypothetical protein [Limnobacter sp.]
MGWFKFSTVSQHDATSGLRAAAQSSIAQVRSQGNNVIPHIIASGVIQEAAQIPQGHLREAVTELANRFIAARFSIGWNCLPSTPASAPTTAQSDYLTYLLGLQNRLTDVLATPRRTIDSCIRRAMGSVLPSLTAETEKIRSGAAQQIQQTGEEEIQSLVQSTKHEFAHLVQSSRKALVPALAAEFVAALEQDLQAFEVHCVEVSAQQAAQTPVSLPQEGIRNRAVPMPLGSTPIAYSS